ncbi:histidine kinase [Paenibacillus contaminans]|uniref:Histidine kinase n=1 Tax=Paenibacillus contaminans TaxID=450362 RepID=A0A329MGV8_9BACL|nr:histidine kinase [Paenibacillus contaminans]
MELSGRQWEIVDIVKKHAPITGEQIAEQLGLSRPTIRSDLALLVMLGYIDAKPKVGYFLGKKASNENHLMSKLTDIKVRDVQAMPVIVRESANVNDAVITMFIENVGSLIVGDEEGNLVGIISRKDLLKVTLGNPGASTMPVSLVMTRQPNIITVSPDDSILEAGRRLIHHQVDSLPVVAYTKSSGKEKLEIVGRVSKTTLIKALIGKTGGMEI